MSPQHDPVEALASIVEDLARHARGEDSGLADRLGQAGTRRAERLDAAHRRLASHLGEDHPRAAVLQGRRDRLDRIGALANVAAARREAQPRRRPQEWVAQGRVVDARGRPLKGLTVRLTDRERQFAELLGDTRTDADGMFRLPYHRKVFGDKAPELLLIVEDRAGRTLGSSGSGVVPRADRTDFYTVVIAAETDG